MRSVCHITLTTHSTQPSTHIEIQIRTKTSDISTQCAWPHSMEDLRKQIEHGKATKSALRTTALTLGKVLMHEEVGDTIRQLIQESFKQDTPVPSDQIDVGKKQSLQNFEAHIVLALHLDEVMASWPWELVMDPKTNKHLLQQGVELIRCVGPSYIKQGVEHKGYVFVGANESFKFNAIKAATAQLNRRFKVQLRSIQTKEQVEDISIQQRILLSHIYAIDAKGVVSLDHQVKRLNEHVSATQSYFLNISSAMNPIHHVRARQAGSTLVLGRQIELSVKEKAESDRALYHALGSGYDIINALHWARYVLMTNQPQHYHWASLTLSVPPIEGSSEAHPAFNLLNYHLPPARAENVTIRPKINQAQAQAQELQTSYATHYEFGFFPALSTESFVHDTVKLIQKSRLPDHDAEKVALALRTSAMKQLSSQVKHSHELPSGMTRSEQLTYQLIQAGRFQDEALAVIPSWFGYAQNVASRLGIQVEAVAQAIQALYINQSLCICGGDEQQRIQLVRSLCAEIFHSYPYEPAQQQPIISTGSLHTQAFCDALNMGWVDDQLIVDDTQAVRPNLRQNLVAYHEKFDHWMLFKRAWLVVDGDQCNTQQFKAMEHALHEGVWHTYDTEQQQNIRVYVPQDFRVIYLSEQAAPLSADLVSIEIKPNASHLIDIYKQHVRNHLLGYMSSEYVEARLNQLSSVSFLQSVKGLENLQLISRRVALSSLSYALWNGGEAAHCVEAAELYLYPHLKAVPSRLEGLINAYQADELSLAEQCWQELGLPGQMINIASYVVQTVTYQ